MSSKIAGACTLILLYVSAATIIAAETLEDALRAAGIPTRQFPASDLSEKITSYAVSNDDPFLLAYYIDHGSELLQPPLRVIRYEHATGNLRRADLRDIRALFQGEIPMDCLGSALAIREYRGIIYIDTHYNPSAGCVIVLSSRLAFRSAVSGWLLGLMGSEYAIFRGSEIHFMSVHPMHIEVFDLARNRSTEVYPYKDDPQRREFSRLIDAHISRNWCMEHAAECDPEDFDADLRGNIIVNENARVFGFLAQFDAAGFGDAAEKQVPSRTVAYVFRQRGGRWEHREFPPRQLQRLLGGMSFGELIGKRPDLAFQLPASKSSRQQ